MNKRKTIIFVSLLVIIIVVSIITYLIFRPKNCEDYSYDNCPIGCIVSSSGPATDDIGCFPSDHEKNWKE